MLICSFIQNYYITSHKKATRCMITNRTCPWNDPHLWVWRVPLPLPSKHPLSKGKPYQGSKVKEEVLNVYNGLIHYGGTSVSSFGSISGKVHPRVKQMLPVGCFIELHCSTTPGHMCLPPWMVIWADSPF